MIVHHPPLIVVGPSRNGVGAFTVMPIPRGTVVWDWTGSRQYRRDQLPKPYTVDQYLQVAEDLYIGPDGGPCDPTDYANHSCAPNCEIEINLPRVVIVAIRDISAGEEITYDYSLTQLDPWEMKCNCGSLRCRRIIRERGHS